MTFYGLIFSSYGVLFDLEGPWVKNLINRTETGVILLDLSEIFTGIGPKRVWLTLVLNCIRTCICKCFRKVTGYTSVPALRRQSDRKSRRTDKSGG